MAISFGRNVLVTMAKESSYNTYIGTGHEGIRVLPGSRLKMERDIREEISGRGQAGISPYDMASGLRRWAYDCTFNLPKEAFAHPLLYSYGAIVTTVIATTWNKHVISINDPTAGTDPTPPSFSVRILDDNREWQLSGGVIATMTIRMALENFWQVQLGIIGGSYSDITIGAAPSYTLPAQGRHFLTSDDFDFWVNQATGSAANWTASNWEVTFKRNYAEGATESYSNSSAERIRLSSAGTPAFDVTGSTRRIYDGITQFDLFDAYTQFRMEARTKTVSPEQLGAEGGSNYLLRMSFEKCYLTSWEIEDSSGIQMQKLDWRATYAGTATDIQVITQDNLTTPATTGTP